MRTFQATLAALIVFGAVAPSHAQEVTGTYEAKFEEVANNCSTVGLSLTRNKIRIRKEKKDQIVIDIELVP
ncbi:MAG: hypothetical protein IPI49_17995, partial [Myxococcales bacterium]|nr:hypothetical protein [Myxococcales bacterium]